MDPFEMLKEDHERVKSILAKLEKTTERAVKTRTELFAKLEQELRTHEEIEEKILYPALKAHEKLKDIVLEGFQEHHVADLLLAEIEGVSVEGEVWGAKVKVLQESIEHHIEEEEEKMFPRAKKDFSSEQLQQLSERMQTLKKELQAEHPKKAA